MYDDLAEQYKRDIEKHKPHLKILKFVKNSKIPYFNILELGSANCKNTITLLEQKPGAKATCVDIAKTAFEGINNPRITTVISPAEKFASRKKFDLILVISLLEHVADPVEILKNARKHISDHGHIVVLVPILNIPLLRRPLIWLYRKIRHPSRKTIAEEHLRVYSDKELFSQINSAGFIIDKVHYNSFWSFMKKLGAYEVIVSAKPTQKNQ